jgi:hypothetical protein
MLGTGPRGEVVAAFSDHLQRKVGAETVDRGDVLSEQREERGANVEGAVAGVVGIESGVVSGVFNLESSGVRASDWRPRHDKR